jgi:phosphatidate phosphatase APP1
MITMRGFAMTCRLPVASPGKPAREERPVIARRAGSAQVWQGVKVSLVPARQTAPPGLHRAAQLEDAVHRILERRARRRGWTAGVVPYTGYGAPGWVRVLARILFAPAHRPSRRTLKKLRGWRSFATLPARDMTVVVEAGARRTETCADRGGYVDVVVEADLEPGWRTVRLIVEGANSVDAPVFIVDPAVRLAIVSDVDDTVMVTALPRPLLAAWNTFVLDEHARMAVPGMAVLYERLVTAHPGAPVFYLSTGAWNVAPTLTRFLSRHLYPAGPLLLTDWGPTPERWFRSGQEHKRANLARLAQEFSQVKWLLVGDDGQHDQEIYAEFVAAHPHQVAGVAIRRLSPTQAVLAGSLAAPPEASRTAGPAGQKWLSAPDGAGLASLMQDVGIL